MRIPTLTSNENFREALTQDEANVFDTIRANKGLTAKEVEALTGVARGSVNTIYLEALSKFVKLATRTEM